MFAGIRRLQSTRPPSARSRPTVRPSNNARPGRSSSGHPADRRPGTSRKSPECRPVCGPTPAAECASDPGRRTAGPARRSTPRSRRCRRSRAWQCRAAPGCRTSDSDLPGSNTARCRESRGDCAGPAVLRGTHTRPPSPRADSLISRNLSAPGNGRRMDLNELRVGVLGTLLETAADGTARADHRHRRTAVNQAAAATGDHHRVGRKGADLHRHQILPDSSRGTRRWSSRIGPRKSQNSYLRTLPASSQRRTCSSSAYSSCWPVVAPANAVRL